MLGYSSGNIEASYGITCICLRSKLCHQKCNQPHTSRSRMVRFPPKNRALACNMLYGTIPLTPLSLLTSERISTRTRHQNYVDNQFLIIVISPTHPHAYTHAPSPHAMTPPQQACYADNRACPQLHGCRWWKAVSTARLYPRC